MENFELLLKELLSQEEELQFREFRNDDALYVGTQYRAKNTTFEQASRLDIDQYAAHGGAFPVIVRNFGVVGTVTVSGLPQEEDHRLVVQVLREFLAG